MPKTYGTCSRNGFLPAIRPRMYELEGAIGNCKQQDDSVFGYFCKLTKMWDELANCERAPDYFVAISHVNRSQTKNANERKKGYTSSYLT